MVSLFRTKENEICGYQCHSTDDQPATEKIQSRKPGTIPANNKERCGYSGPTLTRVRMPLLPLLVPHMTGCVSISLDQCFFGSSSRNVGVLTLTKAVEVKTQDIFKISSINC